VLGLESHTFEIGNAKYAQANHIQKEYKGRLISTKAIRELSLPDL
jgi:hypothetical protein